MHIVIKRDILTRNSREKEKRIYLEKLSYVDWVENHFIMEKAMRQALVSILIRTCQRPDVLRKALDSIKNQTYKNIQVIVVEDGENRSEDLLKKEYSELNYVYMATGQKVGRSKAGNLALKLADGEYLNFLDDDDYFYSNHVEVLIRAIQSGKYEVAYSVAQECYCLYNKQKRRYHEFYRHVRYRVPFNRMYLSWMNYLPIQSVLFSRQLYLKYGGFREDYESLEDWDLWVRYACGTEFYFVNEITSLYHVPVWQCKRQRILDYSYTRVVDNFEQYKIESDASACSKALNQVLSDFQKPKSRKVLSKIYNWLFYRDVVKYRKDEMK